MASPSDIVSRPFWWRRRKALLLIGLAGGLMLGGLFCHPLTFEMAPSPSPPSAGLRLMSWNIAHGRGALPFPMILPRWRAKQVLHKMAALLRHYRPHLVGLQEVDRQAAWSGHIDQLAYLSRHSHLSHYVYGLNSDRKKWPFFRYGNGLLSCWPIQKASSHPFGQLQFGQKGFLYAEVKSPKGVIPLLVLHLDYRSRNTRRQQTKRVLAFLKSLPHLPIVLGDWNGSPQDPQEGVSLFLKELPQYRSASKVSLATFPSFWPRKALDHILLPPTWQVRKVRVISTTLSDHLPLLVELERKKLSETRRK